MSGGEAESGGRERAHEQRAYETDKASFTPEGEKTLVPSRPLFGRRLEVIFGRSSDLTYRVLATDFALDGSLSFQIASCN